MSKSFISLLALLLVFLFCPGKALAEKQADKRGARVSSLVMASPLVTYAALRAMRDEDPSGCKVLSSGGGESVIEEVFDGLPLIGQATCVYRETYDPPKTVSFKMIRSEKLKAFEGEWTLQPVDDGRHTMVNLRSYIDTGLNVPFARKITDMAGTNELKQQIADLKKSAELKQKKQAERSKNQTL